MPEVKATYRYMRTSAFKVREVLDLVRGRHVQDAREILLFHPRGPAKDVLKVLESAVANAEHNSGLPADELFVSKCFADEGITLKRWRPRARGRATRIRKRTSHVTVIVDRMTAEQLSRREAKAERTSTRSARVAASRRAQAKAEPEESTAPDETEAATTEAEPETAEPDTETQPSASVTDAEDSSAEGTEAATPSADAEPAAPEEATSGDGEDDLSRPPSSESGSEAAAGEPEDEAASEVASGAESQDEASAEGGAAGQPEADEEEEK